MKHSWHSEPHFIQRNNWLRASVLGANDGLISTASLLLGLVAANATTHTLLLTGSAALVAGAVSMAAGEYVSVSSQTDTETADLRTERDLLDKYPNEELNELTQIYIKRGLDASLAHQVAQQLMDYDDLDAHARDELGITDTSHANPLEAAVASALSFVMGAIIPVLVVMISSTNILSQTIVTSTLAGLALLGYASAKLGGAPVMIAIVRVLVWGIIALSVTFLTGHLFGVSLG